jgi:hypothetical protein
VEFVHCAAHHVEFTVEFKDGSTCHGYKYVLPEYRTDRKDIKISYSDLLE